MTPSDPLYAQQWHFSVIGAVETVWSEFSGEGVSVAVYDTGVQYSHTDLAANYDTSKHFDVYDGTPIVGGSGHGTSVAGLLAAVQGNGEGGVGVAWGATITSINFVGFLQFFNDEEKVSASLRWAQSFDIMLNSWGKDPDFGRSQSLGYRSNETSRIDAEYAVISAAGRDGLGTVIVQAAGNEASNANGDGVNASRFTITVAATDQTGLVADYSNYGYSLLVAAPAAEVTTDMLFDAGYNARNDEDPIDFDYTSEFGGTSAATPIVAGVAALMLEAAPDLGWRDVHNILAMSARLTGSITGQPTNALEIGPWLNGGYDNWNVSGRAYHQSYGYGMIDAHGAVRMAEAWLTMQGAARTMANEFERTARYAGPLIALQDASGSGESGVTELSVNVVKGIEIETVYVSINITHSYASDLEIALIDPSGQTFQLSNHDTPYNAFENGLRWTFAIEALRGSSSEGHWALKVVDTITGDTGTLSDFELRFFGSKLSTSDVHHFTDDFLATNRGETEILEIVDRDDGIDWLNFSAVTGNILAEMSSSRDLSVDGVHWGRMSGSADAFERFYAGDGNDVITGNRVANVIYGARGDDRLSGLIGNDLLDGGQGDDRMLGGNGLDTLQGGEGRDFLDGGRNSDTLTGGGGSDAFVFSTNDGTDIVTDFADDVDTLRLDDRLWSGVMTVQEVITGFATNLQGGGVVFDFGSVEITLQLLADRQLLINDIVIF